jgi:8-oxo-dGTP diphosphatase
MAIYCQECGSTMVSRQVDGRLRDVCTECGYIAYSHWKVSAGVRVVNDGKVLLVKRRNDPYKDCWHMPAGYVEVDEEPARAAEREALEETGLVVQAQHLVDCYLDTEDPRGNVLILIYDAIIVDGKLTTNNEVEALDFFSLQQLQKLPLAGMSAEKEISDWTKTLDV